MTPFDSQPPETGASSLRGDIAIVGMGCLFAGAPNLDAFWQNILAKVDAISDPPADEWDPKVFYDPKAKSNDRVYCKRGGYIGDLSQFRPLDFGIMPVTVDGGEPDQWLALRVAQEALADAGYLEPPMEHMRTEVILGKGTYVNRGNLTVGYHGMIVEYFLQALRNLHPEYTEAEIHAIKTELKAGLPPFSADTAPALIGNIIAGRIANRLDLMGPSFTVDAACASALLAIEIGVRDLLSHKCDLVLAGGANINAPLPTMTLFCQLGALSRGEQIRPFDEKADGTILGEGLGMVVLKRREDAERDGSRIYAVIKGVGLASDGRALHVMAPRIEGEELALRRAYDMAGVSPETVGLIEAHGTATPVGDVVEVQALSRLFGQRKESLPTCALGSVKSMIGHTMPAAGIAGVIKTALSLYHRVLPPTLNCDKPNPALNLDKTPFYINTETRPWIHGADTPRRAGVNSFGFGGINAHVVLEEHPVEQQDPRSHQLHWDSEVCILEAESRQALIERTSQLTDYLAGTAAHLKDVAYSLNTQLNGKPSRLAVIATSKEDLVQKLKGARERLADPKCQQIKDNSGIYFFERRLQGKLAFLFPGEGAQYPNMLLDLCVHFPEVRRCFDLVDRALTHGSRNILPSEMIFPRSILSGEDRARLEKALWQMDGAVEGVLIGNWAMWTLLSLLEIRPDVIVGHSTGDYSAMLASNIIPLANDEYIEATLEWNRAHARLAERLPVPEATLVAVASDSSTVMSIVEAVGRDIYLAMDNCPHQSVLVGSKIAAEQAIEYLRRRGIIYEILPFDRPYHTPMFHAYAEGAGAEFFARLPIAAPTIETYSCTTAACYPMDPDEIRRLFVAHWERPVLFTDTVKKMYDDGVRLFVESGPRGNLTSFVSDILRGKPHLAMPANVPRRSGIAQINHLVGILAAQGVGMRLNYLYGRRNPQMLEWEETSSAPAKQQSAPMKLPLALPALKLSPRPVKAVSSAATPTTSLPQKGDSHHSLSAHTEQTAPPSPEPPLVPAIAAHRAAPSTQNVPAERPGTHTFQVSTMSPVKPVVPNGTAHDGSIHQVATPATPAVRMQPRPVSASGRTSAMVMQEYFKGMEAFLDVETQVMGAFLNRQRTASASTSPAPTPKPFPLLGTITSMVPGQELTAIRRLSLAEDTFLLDHALGGRISVTDPELRPLVVVPLTMSMEILAEAAAALLPGQVLVGMRDIQAHHWIRVDDTPVDLQITARRIANSSREVAVQVRNLAGESGQKGATTVLEGVVMFEDAYPTPPRAANVKLMAERPSPLRSASLYDGRLMFHGPCFQGVARVDRSGQDGVIGQLRVLPAEKLFRSVPNPQFVTDPVLLDAAGQLVGFWSAEYLQRGFVVFPYHLDSLRVYGPNRPAGEVLTCSVALQLQGSESMRSNIEIAGADGTVWMQLQGWADRRFDPPQRFHRAWTTPQEAMISEQWEAPLKGVRGKGSLECCRLESPFEAGTGLWKDLWASLILTRRERKAFAERGEPEHRQMQWLSGRTVAKDAVRDFARKHYGLELLAADIEIAEDERGRLVARGPWPARLGAAPVVCVAQSGRLTVALAGDGSNGRQLGIHFQALRDVKTDFDASVLNANEQRLLSTVPEPLRAEWTLRLQCAKEAVAKALAPGLPDGPRSVRIMALSPQTGFVRAALQRLPTGVEAEAVGAELLTYTAREDAYVLAIAIYEKGTS